MTAFKIIFAIFTAYICLFAPQAILSQVETLDIVQFTPPKGWTRTPKDGAVAFVDVNKTTGNFCILTIFASTPSTGTAQKDFDREWDGLLVKPFKAAANPKTQTQSTPEGWQVTVGAGEIEAEGGKSIALLTVITGFGKTVSVLANLNEQSYLAQVDALVASIKLDKDPPAAAPDAAAPAAVAASSVAGKFGTISYTPPSGFTEQQFSDGVVFLPKDLPGEFLIVQILRPLNATGTLEEALAQSWNDTAAVKKATSSVVTTGGYYNKTEVKRSFAGWEYIRGRGTIQVENGTPYKTNEGLELFVVKVNNRFERVAITESLSCNRPTNRVRWIDPIEDFLFSMQFDDLRDSALPNGSVRGTGIIGVWQGIAMSVGVTSTSKAQGVGYSVYSPVFLTNGQAYFGNDFPPEGLDGVNTRVQAEIHRRDWGTYTFSNGRGVVKMPYGDIPIRMEGNKLIITKDGAEHAFIKMTPVDGATFSGTYTFSEYNGKIPTITLAPDGRFNDNGAIEIMYHAVGNECVNPASAPGSGTYEVKDYTLTFNYTDGRKLKMPFLGIGYDKSNPSPATLVFTSVDQKFVRR
jgi:hypothetical protein